MKIKLLSVIAVLAIAGTLSGCSEATARSNVMKAFPGCAFTNVPDHKNDWIIRKPDGAVWYAWDDGANGTGTPSHMIEIIPVKQL